MTDELCVICGDRPAHGAYGCLPCLDQARRSLTDIADMAVAAQDVAHRQAVRGTGAGTSGKPGSTLPIDLGATARLDAVTGSLTTWVRHVAEERGVNLREIHARGISRLSRGRVGVDHVEGLKNDLSGSALWLADHCEWMRHRSEVREFARDIDASTRIMRGLARGPAAHRYLGPCGADLSLFTIETGIGNGSICDGDIYGIDGAPTGRCRTCGAHHSQAERLKELAALTEGRAYRAAHIAHAYGIPVKSIRTWARRGKLRSWWFDGEQMQLWTDTDDQDELRARGPRLHVVADVLALRPPRESEPA